MCSDLLCRAESAVRVGHSHCSHEVHALLAKVGEEGVVVRDDDGVAGVVQQLGRQHSRVVWVAALDSLVTYGINLLCRLKSL